MENAPEKDPRVYFAAERTFLAWIRTGIGLMGVGFAVSRFALFLREIQAANTKLPLHVRGISAWSGIALVLLGVAVNLSAVVGHLQTVRDLKSGTGASLHACRCSRLPACGRRTRDGHLSNISATSHWLN